MGFLLLAVNFGEVEIVCRNVADIDVIARVYRIAIDVRVYGSGKCKGVCSWCRRKG